MFVIEKVLYLFLLSLSIESIFASYFNFLETFAFKYYETTTSIIINIFGSPLF